MAVSVPEASQVETLPFHVFDQIGGGIGALRTDAQNFGRIFFGGRLAQVPPCLGLPLLTLKLDPLIEHPVDHVFGKTLAWANKL